jgi:prepilin-type N-terminal cleavage/methylation domain-containing protein
MQRGFSLVELSIVLVILGLLTGGILGGQSLIRAAELRAVSTEHQRYVAAANTFRDKYFAIPGDFNNAQNFWGISTACSGASTTGTCNGNGDGLLTDGAANASGEGYQFWRQLALAGLIEGTYTGVAGATQYVDATVGVNVPRSRMNNGEWFARYGTTTMGNSNIYALDYGNFLLFGGYNPGSWANGGILKPEEAWNIDTKMDDGKPAQGKVIAFYWNNACAAPNGTAANTNFDANYNLTNTTLTCALFFRQAF